MLNYVDLSKLVMKNTIYSKLFSLILGLSLIVNISFAQTEASLASQRAEGYEQRSANSINSLAGGMEMTNIGPTIMSGRVVDIDVNEAATQNYYVAYASGG